jgi:hypothetical protein
VIRQAKPERGNPYRAELTQELRLDAPGWCALRIESTTKNELGQTLFAHTSPVYVELEGKRRFDIDAALALLRDIEESQASIRSHATFSSEEARRPVLALYEEAARLVRARINERR